MKMSDLAGHQAAIRPEDLFDPAAWARAATVVASSQSRRLRLSCEPLGDLQRDEFPDLPGLSCVFMSRHAESEAQVRFEAHPDVRIIPCPAGGWLLEAADPSQDSWWIPCRPMLRTFDRHGRILVEEQAQVTDFAVLGGLTGIGFSVPAGLNFNAVIWRIEPQARQVLAELQSLLNVERTRTYLWSSQSTIGLPAELYLHLIDGRIFENARAYPQKWKFCCDLDAYEIFLRLTGLERSTGKRLYGLLRRQVLLSTLARQSADGAWYHGEWTDMNECHLRFMNGALLLIENALEDWPDPVLKAALARGLAYAAGKTDKTQLGHWFLHDSVEESPASMDEMHRQTGAIVKGHGAWRPTTFLGKAPTNKMILNTHVDTLVTFDRHRRLTGDATHDALIASAHGATQAAIALQPVPALYRLVDRLIGLTMLPAAQAARLPLPLRAVKRLANDLLLPNLWRIKHRWPRFLFPGGYIDRHLGPLQFSAKYHSVNVMDLVRLYRLRPDHDLRAAVAAGVRHVMARDAATLRWWQELKSRRVAIGTFGEALVQLCALDGDFALRRHLARVLQVAHDTGIGLPPSALGGNAEVHGASGMPGCPSAAAARLIVVAIGPSARPELLVVNPTRDAIPLGWETPPPAGLQWFGNADRPVTVRSDALVVPARGFVLGRPDNARDSTSNPTEATT